MRTKLQKFFTRLILSILGLCVIVVTLFLFLYVFWKGKKVFSLSFLLDKPAGVPLGTAGGIYPALMGFHLPWRTFCTDRRYPWYRRCHLSCILQHRKTIFRPCKYGDHRAFRNPFDPVRAGWIYASDLPFWT